MPRLPFLALLFALCAYGTAAAQPLVRPAWFKAHLLDPKVVVLEVEQALASGNRTSIADSRIRAPAICLYRIGGSSAAAYAAGLAIKSRATDKSSCRPVAAGQESRIAWMRAGVSGTRAARWTRITWAMD